MKTVNIILSIVFLLFALLQYNDRGSVHMDTHLPPGCIPLLAGIKGEIPGLPIYHRNAHLPGLRDLPFL